MGDWKTISSDEPVALSESSYHEVWFAIVNDYEFLFSRSIRLPTSPSFFKFNNTLFIHRL